jgi:hypothetical protein
MTQKLVRLTQVWIGLMGVVSLTQLAEAQPFVAHNGDLIAGFRKTGAHQANYELVVNVGNITNFEALSPGSTVAISNYVPSQLSDAFSDYNNLQWSVAAAFPGAAKWAGYPSSTIWYTIARSDERVQSQPPQRIASGGQQQTRQAILSVSLGAASISANLGTSNQDNNVFLVREPLNDPNDLTSFIGDTLNSAVGDFASTLPFSVESTTPAAFAAAARSDLYQSCPSGTTDPTTGLTTGMTYLVGYFTLDPAGTMTFTRASTNSTPPLPPPAPVLSLARSGTTTTISIQTTNGATYTLYYTNSAGLSAPVTAWSSPPSTVAGDGSTKSFTDSTTDADRVYRVGAH